LAKLLETVTLQFLDRQPAEFREQWNDPIPPWNKPITELTMTKEQAKKLWVRLLAKRPEGQYVDCLVITDSGGTDRRALSVALAIAKSLSLPVRNTIWAKRFGEDWQADDKTVLDNTKVNAHVFEMVKAGRSLVIGGAIPLRPAPRPKSYSFEGHPTGAVRGVHY
jgi:hypothetical protein